MTSRLRRRVRNSWDKILLPASVVLLAGILLVQPVAAKTHISAEPIPSGDVIGAADLEKILAIGYLHLERWSRKILEECETVENVIRALSSENAITTVNRGNVSVDVAAGGFEAVTNPAFVFTVKDSGRGAVSAEDVGVLNNALGYVLSQGGTVHFSPDDPSAYDFPLDYAVVSFARNLTGLQAKVFFDFLGTIDPALWSGPLAGFTQIDDSMLFLQPDTSKRQFVTGLYRAAAISPRATYETLDRRGRPTTATAGVAFPGNDWILFPEGDQYLMNLGTPTPRLLNELASLRRQHLTAVADLLRAIERGHVRHYLNHQFSCPR